MRAPQKPAVPASQHPSLLLQARSVRMHPAQPTHTCAVAGPEGPLPAPPTIKARGPSSMPPSLPAACSPQAKCPATAAGAVAVTAAGVVAVTAAGAVAVTAAGDVAVTAAGLAAARGRAAAAAEREQLLGRPAAGPAAAPPQCRELRAQQLLRVTQGRVSHLMLPTQAPSYGCSNAAANSAVRAQQSELSSQVRHSLAGRVRHSVARRVRHSVARRVRHSVARRVRLSKECTTLLATDF